MTYYKTSFVIQYSINAYLAMNTIMSLMARQSSMSSSLIATLHSNFL